MDSQDEGGEDVFGVFNPIADSDLVFREKRPKELHEYYIGAVLGKGSFGKVKEAVDKKTRKLVAIKIIKERLLIKTPGGIDAAHREIELWQTLDHPCIVHMYDHFSIEDKGKIYIVMELVDCGNLHDLVLHAPAKKLPIPQARKFFRDLLEGIRYIHSIGIIHKDIKPANCMISSNVSLKICDFGVAERKSDIPLARRASTVNAVGSPAFQPPEIASGEEKIPDFAVDIWALGICLYFMVCGQYPFRGENVITLLENIAQCHWELPDDVDESTRNLISAILRVEKSERLDLQRIQENEWMLVDDSEYLSKHLHKGKNKKNPKVSKSNQHDVDVPWAELHPFPSMFDKDSKGLVKMDFEVSDNADDDDNDDGKFHNGSNHCCIIS